MALPVETPVDDWGPATIDMVMTEETAEQEKSQYPDISYLGGGRFGMAVDLGDGKVGKYTASRSEANFAQSLVGRDVPGLVSVYDVRQLQSSEQVGKWKDLWVIITERVTVLPKGSRENAVATQLYRAVWRLDGNMPSLDYMRDNRRFPLEHSDLELYFDYSDLIENLRAAGVDPEKSDAHGYNVGYSGAELVLFDLGFYDAMGL